MWTFFEIWIFKNENRVAMTFQFYGKISTDQINKKIILTWVNLDILYQHSNFYINKLKGNIILKRP
jgi:hypothetical protein